MIGLPEAGTEKAFSTCYKNPLHMLPPSYLKIITFYIVFTILSNEDIIYSYESIFPSGQG